MDFQEYLKDKLSKISMTIRLLRKFQENLTTPSLPTTNNSFIRPRLNKGDITYDKS